MAEPSAYFVRGDDGEEYGPVPLAELREWVVENRVGLGTSIRPDAPESRWSAWQHYPELVALLAEVNAVGRPGGPTVLAPLSRRAGAFIVDVFLSFLLVLGLVVILYAFLPRQVIVDQTQFWLQFYTAVVQGINPPVNPPELPQWYLIGAEILSFVVPVLYFSCFPALHGQTPAKTVLHLHIVDAEGRKPTLRVALLRGFILVVSIKLWGIPLLYAFFNPQRRALHDIAAGTYVIEP